MIERVSPVAKTFRSSRRFVMRLSTITVLALPGCSPDISSPTYVLDSDGTPAGLSHDLMMGVSPGTLPYDPIPPIPDGAVPPSGLIEPLGSVASAAARLTRGECLLQFRRGPFGYTPVDFRPDTSGFADHVDETAVVVMHLMRGEIIRRRAVCIVPKSLDDAADVGEQLRAQLQQPAGSDALVAQVKGNRVEPADSSDENREIPN